MASIQDLIQGDSQKRLFIAQVWRNNNWVTLKAEAVKGSVAKSKAGQVLLTISEDSTDATRSQLYEGDRIRMYRGVEGAPLQRCWTGFVDTRTPTKNTGTSVGGGGGAQNSVAMNRQYSVTDYIKELTDAIMLDGVVYDGWAPNAACVDLISRAISSSQFQPFDDNGNVISNTASYSSPNGNPLLYFPNLTNDDGSTFNLPKGTLASFTAPNGAMASFSIPVASNSTYSTFMLPKRYIVASTFSMPGFTQVTTSAQFPPAKGQVYLDGYNGILYFNPGDASTTASFSATYYDSPLFDYPAGKKVGDVITEILDKTGARWMVDGTGKIQMQYIDAIRAPKAIYSPSKYVQHGVQINRDRRNVIVALGWDGNCGTLLAAKAVNYDDISNLPPKGLGKRAYMIIQDPSWKTQYAVSKAVYYAVQQVGRRGKVTSLTILDDPTLGLEDVLCFESGLPEISNGDFFYVEGLNWEMSIDANGGIKAQSDVSGTMLPGRGTVYLGPINGVTPYGGLDFTQDVECFTNAALSPSGGTYASTFSIASGLTLSYTIAALAGTESIDLYGSDGSHYVITSNVARAANQTLNLALTVSECTPGVMYVLRLWFKDSSGNIGVYRDFITARA